MGAKLKTISESTGKMAEGFCTPREDKSPQKMCVPPRRVIPIIFIPGIMGTNLRLTKDRQEKLGKKNNIAWNADKLADILEFKDYGPARRQLQLDQAATEVEVYDPANNPTGNPKETADKRNSAVELSDALRTGSSNVLHDPAGKPRDNATARRRGWGEVLFGSYKDLLEKCELCFNDLSSPHWRNVLDVDPALWGAHPGFSLKAISLHERDAALRGCIFPVHAIGYNWLRTNIFSALSTRERIDELIARYRGYGYDCRKVILVTHSMGGLVARALVHPSIGNYEKKVLGVVHGVMPAAGAPAAYKRIRCGVEGIGPASGVLGSTGPAVSAVLANSPGGLELLPSSKYGNGWLKICRDSAVVKSLPVQGDPYEEIYKLKGKWYGLMVDEWLNPANDVDGGSARTTGYLANAKYFHELIGDTYHPNSYAHYGVDPDRPSWETIVWNSKAGHSIANPDQWTISSDRGRGSIEFLTGEEHYGLPVRATAELAAANGAGDQTVPARSAESQLKSGAFKGIFEQRGYEHQLSYKDANALNSTIYCITKIVQSMNWD